MSLYIGLKSKAQRCVKKAEKQLKIAKNTSNLAHTLMKLNFRGRFQPKKRSNRNWLPRDESFKMIIWSHFEVQNFILGRFGVGWSAYRISKNRSKIMKCYGFLRFWEIFRHFDFSPSPLDFSHIIWYCSAVFKWTERTSNSIFYMIFINSGWAEVWIIKIVFLLFKNGEKCRFLVCMRIRFNFRSRLQP